MALWRGGPRQVGVVVLKPDKFDILLCFPYCYAYFSRSDSGGEPDIPPRKPDIRSDRLSGFCRYVSGSSDAAIEHGSRPYAPFRVRWMKSCELCYTEA